MTTNEKAATALLDQIVKILQDENWLGLPGASVLPLLTNAFESAWVEGNRQGQREHAAAVDIVAAQAARNAQERDAAVAQRDKAVAERDRMKALCLTHEEKFHTCVARYDARFLELQECREERDALQEKLDGIACGTEDLDALHGVLRAAARFALGPKPQVGDMSDLVGAIAVYGLLSPAHGLHVNKCAEPA